MDSSTNKTQLVVNLATDRKSLVVEYRDASGISLRFALTASEATQFCELLSKHRSFAIPEVEQNLVGRPSLIVSEPSISVQSFDSDQQKLLSFRHPGFGWISFTLSDASSQLLSDALAVKPPVIVAETGNKRRLH